MKALMKDGEETVTEDMGIIGIDWNTGMPLTHPDRCGGAYRLTQNYVPPKDDEPAQYGEVVEPEQVEVEDKDDYVIIDGKKYSKEELRALL